MAYNLFPSSEDEIRTIYSDTNHQEKTEVVCKLYNFLSEKHETPLALNPDHQPNFNSVKIIRNAYFDIKPIEEILETQFTIDKVVANIPDIKLNITFGDGSRGNRGINNRGNSFESELSDDMNRYFDSVDHSPKFDGFIQDFDKIADGLENYDVRFSEQLGGLNNKRPLVFLDDNPLIGGYMDDIGDVVTDVNVQLDGITHYLSLKMGGTTTFFNSGVSKILPSDEITSGRILNINGQKLLDTLGIHNESFCNVFNDYQISETKIRSPKLEVEHTGNKDKIENLLKSGIGYGYTMVHLEKGTDTHVFPVNRDTVEKVSKVNSMVVSYPTNGSAKRVDVHVETDYLKLKFNIRNKQGGLYPTHVMCDYKWKKHPD